ncbi:four-carbon acid sugar kinase family protein (plasmid) [Cupriavidus pinatubonensis]|uniref:four-carbon acid sugar kinase family protein n=1 Tax=Cupriavidus pinatubonensis TaxID=248026 RepID=UPI001C738E9C|nr:four-carbon acid sugar kinase family protein [Cupriavidus pinatubonensis]QYY33856.1 four-carbon acid sugar kinase family protein [Cupriavidus pinatubonensis]
MKSKLKVAFLGDDFTGSTDALEMLAMAGLRCVLFLRQPSKELVGRFEGLDAVGIAGDSRGMTPQEMDTHLPRLYRSLVELDPAVVHYKVCSTFDSSAEIGNIGHAMRLARDSGHFAAGPIAVVGANPSLRRYCVFGNLFAASATDGNVYRIDRHPIMSVHPVTPMRESDLAVHLANQSPMTFGRLTYGDLESAGERLDEHCDRLWDAQTDAVLFDGANEGHMSAVGKQLVRISNQGARPSFVVGSSGVEFALTRAWGASTQSVPAMPAATAVNQVLAISGSGSALTARQIERARESGFELIAVNARNLVDDGKWEAEVEEAVGSAVVALKAGKSVLVHTAKGPGDPRIAEMLAYMQRDGASAAQARHEGGRLLGVGLGNLTREIMDRVELRRLLIAGGDTSSQIMQVVGADALMVSARLAPGAPLCRLISKSPSLDGLEVALKGGQMGNLNFFEEGRRGIQR